MATTMKKKKMIGRRLSPSDNKRIPLVCLDRVDAETEMAKLKQRRRDDSGKAVFEDKEVSQSLGDFGEDQVKAVGEEEEGGQAKRRLKAKEWLERHWPSHCN